MTWLYSTSANLDEKQTDGLEKRPYIDTPYFSYVEWLQRSVTNGVTRIGTLDNPQDKKVAIIGAGAAGLSAAYELLALGLDVIVFEQSDKVGGRMDSVKFVPESDDLAELGAMRFPPSEESLFYYFDKFGINTVADFPDPGKVPTTISFKGDVQTIQPGETPQGFERVSNGWAKLMSEGAMLEGNALVAPNTIGEYLTSGNTDAAISAWKTWIEVMDNRSLFNGLVAIFSEQNPPGGQTWKYPEDYERFSALGAGFGGFGPLYQVGFLEIIRLVVNGLETDQRSVPGGVRLLADGFAESEIQRPDGSLTNVSNNLVLNATCTNLTRNCSDISLDVNGETQHFDRVIVATTNRSMEIDTQTARFDENAVINADSAAAIRELHMMNSSKTFVRVATRFWQDVSNNTRVILNDTLSRNVYTLEYGQNSTTGVVLVSYVWGDSSTKDITFVNKEQRLALIRQDIAQTDPNFAKHLYPMDNDYENNVKFIDWESEPHYYGAFKLNRPGQSHFTQSAYYQFLDARSAEDKGVYIAGSAISWTGGWIEGALQTGLNAAAAVVYSFEGEFTCQDYNPFTRLRPDIYEYS